MSCNQYQQFSVNFWNAVHESCQNVFNIFQKIEDVKIG